MVISREAEYNETNEVFKQIGTTIYSVSTHGRVRNDKRMKFLTPRNLRGYARVSLWFDGKANDKRIHRLVAEAFLPNPDCKPEVNHKNGIRNDNRLCNLEWVTPQENVKHKMEVLKQESQQGEKNANSKLSESDIISIRNSKKDAKLLAKEYGVSLTHIYRIKAKKMWSHI